MWKQLIDFATRLFALSQRVQKQEDATTQRSQGLKEMSQRVDQLSAIVQRLAFEL